MNDADGDILYRAQEVIDERIGPREYAAYYWQRLKCLTGRHRYHRRWIGGRACLYCGRIDTSEPHITGAAAYLICAGTGISFAAMFLAGLR